jgi:phage-related minor tail protein
MELIRLGEEQARVREIELDLLRQYDGQVTSSVENEISAAAQRIAAREQELAQLERLRDAQESLADTIADSFEGMMMSIVDGTKTTSEAFRDMARAILAELYRVLVVQQIVGQIRSAVGGSGLIGNFMGSMMGISARASGGPMMAGQPYLVGERGPEIVVPSRSGTVMNSNLSSKVGGSQQVDVRVFVDDNGNFDAKVERISAGTVQKAAPKIIEGAKTAMVNTVQRGGSVARVFR